MSIERTSPVLTVSLIVPVAVIWTYTNIIMLEIIAKDTFL